MNMLRNTGYFYLGDILKLNSHIFFFDQAIQHVISVHLFTNQELNPHPRKADS